ncbi:flavodoxin family protein [Candidatus Stoquefichus massiliensis]|uniref:flavodoxin family protein n=1 Tax=Candidatus Stoquefichus massiliensis TaxID=1470350 RepID=UPI00048220EF|nr:flavodoxin family protein [Candidatus Stoquefichus massiliensis]
MSYKNILVISTSYRSGGNSDTLADAFIKGVQERGNLVTKMNLKDQDIHFCKGCLVCQNKKSCVIQDDGNEIVEKMKNSDVIVFATPIYFYEMSGQMKTLLDRTNPLFEDDYQFRDIYLLTTSADEDESSMNGAILGLEGWIKCFDGVSLKGVVKGVGIDQYGDIEKHTHILKEAYLMGKSIA